MRAIVLALVLSSGVAFGQGYRPANGSGITTDEALSAVQDAGTLATAGKDLFASTFVASNLNSDGGAGTYSFVSNTDSCAKLGPGTHADLCVVGNSMTAHVDAMYLPTTFIEQPVCPENTSCRWNTYPGKWFGTYPQNDVSGCVADAEGGFRAYSADHTLRYCNGTAALTVATTLSASAALDFGTILTGASGTATMTVTGAVSGDSVHCNPTVALSSGVSVAYSYVSAADTVTVTENFIGAVSIDPASANFKCSIVRP